MFLNLMMQGITQGVDGLPASFAGDRLTYAFALFSILFTCSLSMMVMLNSIRNAWEQRFWVLWNHPLSVNRYILWFFVLTLQFMGVQIGRASCRERGCQYV